MKTSLKKICSSLSMAAVGSLFAVPAFASPGGPLLWTINSHDFYGSYSSSLYGTTSAGTSSTLSWQTAGYHWTGTIGLTNAQGKLLALITTTNDNYSLATKGANGFTVVATAPQRNALWSIRVPHNPCLPPSTRQTAVEVSQEQRGWPLFC
jgi:hypothetical protein